MLKRGLFFLIALVLAIPLAGVQAQEALTAGEATAGEITDQKTAVNYIYTAEAGEVVILTVAPKDVSGDFSSPAVIISDSKGREVLNYSGYGKTTAAWIFEEGGKFGVTVTRGDDSSTGAYTLTLVNPTELEMGSQVEDTANSDDTLYYLYRGEQDFALYFEREGAYMPGLNVKQIDQDSVPGSLDTVGSLSGSKMTSGAIGGFRGGEVYLITVEHNLFDFTFGNPSVDFYLEVFSPSEEERKA